MFKTAWTICAALTTLALPAAAVDLDSLSRSQKVTYCVDYIWLDLKGQEQRKALTPSEFSAAETQLIMKTMARSGMSNFPQYGRELEQGLKVIASEKPTDGEIAQKATTCRAYLKL